MVKNSKHFEAGFRYYVLKSQADDWPLAFLKAELRFPILFEVPPEVEILMRLPVKSPELLSVSLKQAKTYKVFFLTIKMQKN